MAEVIFVAGVGLLAFAIAMPCYAVDPQIAVERMKKEVRGEWSIVSISSGETMLDSEHVTGAKWVIGNGTLETFPGSKPTENIIGGTRMKFGFHLRDRTDPFKDTPNWRYAWKWSDDDPFSVELTFKLNGSAGRVFCNLALTNDTLVLSQGSSRHWTSSTTKSTDIVYTLERINTVSD
ncbi:hypothetical protein [Roseiconus lacunae]|uniref:hypothetical protein n=1 Tax=Roseiconus lacunae TaxID=2605694 RepID=UPI0011F1EB98|nr:hypothetical protein [Roseiconus lacunae]